MYTVRARYFFFLTSSTNFLVGSAGGVGYAIEKYMQYCVTGGISLACVLKLAKNPQSLSSNFTTEPYCRALC